MLIAHLPAGYISAKVFEHKWQNRLFLWGALIGSIFPDLDLIYFYLFNDRQTLHHNFWVHIPYYWIIISLVTCFILSFTRLKNYRPLFFGFLLNVFIHLFLDTVVGGIKWLYPFNNTQYRLFDVPAGHSWWIMNYVLNWTFLFEVAIIITAAYLLFKPKTKTAPLT